MTSNFFQTIKRTLKCFHTIRLWLWSRRLLPNNVTMSCSIFKSDSNAYVTLSFDWSESSSWTASPATPTIRKRIINDINVENENLHFFIENMARSLRAKLISFLALGVKTTLFHVLFVFRLYSSCSLVGIRRCKKYVHEVWRVRVSCPFITSGKGLICVILVFLLCLRNNLNFQMFSDNFLDNYLLVKVTDLF